MKNIYNILIPVMSLLSVVVFIILRYFEKSNVNIYKSDTGVHIPKNIGWFLMEFPVLLIIVTMWICSSEAIHGAALLLAVLFLVHYLHRTFILPSLLKTNATIHWRYVWLSIVFNVVNALMEGSWLFYLAPSEKHYLDWFSKPHLYIGGAIFLVGLYITFRSNHRLKLLESGDSVHHHIPTGGLFKYVSSANYFGELIELVGFAIASHSTASVVLLLWTFANLAPRARTKHREYQKEFGEEFTKLNLKSIIPFIY